MVIGLLLFAGRLWAFREPDGAWLPDPVNSFGFVFATTSYSKKGLAVRYAVVNINDLTATLGGFPFDNSGRRYTGCAIDPRLHRQVTRVAADPAAVEAMQAFYTPLGRPDVPLMTLHTNRDPLASYRHERVYLGKTQRNDRNPEKHFNFRFSRYGNCEFKRDEVLLGFTALLLCAEDAGGFESIAGNLAGDGSHGLLDLARKHRFPVNRFRDGRLTRAAAADCRPGS